MKTYKPIERVYKFIHLDKFNNELESYTVTEFSLKSAKKYASVKLANLNCNETKKIKVKYIGIL